MKVVHITTVHRRKDSRIFYKECLSLSKADNDVSLIVADGNGNEDISGIHIIDIGAYNSRLKRIIYAPQKAIKMAISLHADIYHFHDPDLLIACRKLAKYDKVIFDSHEDFPSLMLQRDYIPNTLRKTLFILARRIEKHTYKKLWAVVTATDGIKEKFLSYGKGRVECVKNYPIIDNIESQNTKPSNDICTAVYVGGLTRVRGVKEMILSCEKAGVKLILVGPFDDNDYLKECKSLTGWHNVEYMGVVPHSELKQKVYSRADIGLNMLLNAPNHTDSIPIKQFEYMAEGIAVIATKHIRFCVEVTNKTHCGILVYPENIDECSNAIKLLKDNPQMRYDMGERGRKAVIEKYNWSAQAKVLLELYSRV